MERTEQKTAAGINHLKEYVRSTADHAEAQLEPVKSWLKGMIEDRPLALLAGALGAGYLVGRLIRRA